MSGPISGRQPWPADARAVPLRLAELHRSLAVGEVVEIETPTLDDHAPSWSMLVEGGGFALLATVRGRSRLRREDTLADLVGPNLTTLVVGLNPSPTSAARGISFARGGNRFWPAMLAAGLASRDRDPLHAYEHHGVGITDLAKRTTVTAAEIERHEFTAGIERVGALCGWLRPARCIAVGLMGWRAVVDRTAVAGWQDRPLGPTPVYLMPSTSGLNARSSLDELTEHLRRAIEGPPAG